MSGCHNTETTEVKTCPHGVRLEDVCKRCYENSRNTHPCIGCGEPVCECKCIWNGHRELYQMFSSVDTRCDSVAAFAKEKIKELEIRIKDTEEDLNYVPTTEALCALVERVKDLEQSYQGQFHEISNLEDEVAALQSHADRVDTCFGEVLESGKTFHVSRETIGATVEKSLDARLSLTQRIDTLSKRIDSLFEMIPDEIEARCGKKPYCCPVCLGNSEWDLVSMEQVIANGGNRIKKCDACDKGIVWG